MTAVWVEPFPEVLSVGVEGGTFLAGGRGGRVPSLVLCPCTHRTFFPPPDLYVLLTNLRRKELGQQSSCRTGSGQSRETVLEHLG